MKRLLIVSDLHCGHFAGLTPPGHWYSGGAGAPGHIRERAALQRELWKWYEREVRSLGKIDVCVCNGDAIDGKGARSGGTELIVADLEGQAEMATACLRVAEAGQYLLTYGTPYHVSTDGQDFEGQIARDLGGRIGGHEWLDVNGVIFDFKHKVGSSGIPHGRHTAVAKERLWNLLWADRDGAPKSNVITRSHVHHYNFAGGPDYLTMTTPALQGPGSTYGVRQCSGIVDFGFISVIVHQNGVYEWKPHLLRVKSARPAALKV